MTARQPDRGSSLALGTCPECEGEGTPGMIAGYRILCRECLGDGVVLLSYMTEGG